MCEAGRARGARSTKHICQSHPRPEVPEGRAAPWTYQESSPQDLLQTFNAWEVARTTCAMRKALSSSDAKSSHSPNQRSHKEHRMRHLNVGYRTHTFQRLRHRTPILITSCLIPSHTRPAGDHRPGQRVHRPGHLNGTNINNSVIEMPNANLGSQELERQEARTRPEVPEGRAAPCT